MRKGAWIRVAVWVEGDGDPASDFGKLAVEAVKNSAGLNVPAKYNKLKLQIRSVYEDSDPPPDAGGSDAGTPDEAATTPQGPVASSAGSEPSTPAPSGSGGAAASGSSVRAPSASARSTASAGTSTSGATGTPNTKGPGGNKREEGKKKKSSS